MANVPRALNKTGPQTGSEGEPMAQVIAMAAKNAPSANGARREKTSPAQPSASSAAAQASSFASPLDIPAAERAAEGEPSAFGQPWELPTPVKAESPAINPMILTCHKPRSQASEQFRQLRTTLIRLANRGPVRCMITSAQPREGKTILSANLAYCFSELAPKRTLLIDGDLRRGRQAELFGVPNETGLGELLSGKCAPPDACRNVCRPSMNIITAGRADLDAIGQLFGSPSAQTAMRELISQYDYVMLDTPPVLGLADTGMLGSWVDVALLVVRIHKTPRNLIDKAAHVLTSAGVNVAGIVALDEQAHDAKGYYDGYSSY